MSAGIAVVVVAIESVCLRGASLFCCVCAEKKRQRNETKKKRNQAKTNVSIERKKEKKNKRERRTYTLFGELLSGDGRAR